MASKRLGGINGNLENVFKLTGFLDTLGKDLGKSRTLNPVMKFVYQELDESFTLHMAGVAPKQASRFHHVYEWGMIGVPQAKLWDTTLIGTGNQRSIGFNWRASKTQVPLPDPLPAASESGKQLKGGHVFVWKAPVMEYALPVNISPTLSDNLAFMANQIGETPMRNGLWFSGKTERFDSAPNSRLAAGSFTTEFITWWTGSEADRAFSSGIKDAVNRGIGAPAIAKAISSARMNAINSRGRKSTVAARKAGKAEAEKFLRSREDYFSQRLDIVTSRGKGGRWTGGR